MNESLDRATAKRTLNQIENSLQVALGSLVNDQNNEQSWGNTKKQVDDFLGSLITTGKVEDLFEVSCNGNSDDNTMGLSITPTCVYAAWVMFKAGMLTQDEFGDYLVHIDGILTALTGDSKVLGTGKPDASPVGWTQETGDQE